MTAAPSFDVVVVGGGIAGSTLAGVLARAGLGVLVVEKEARFRDRLRGEAAWPWGVAEALRLGLGPVLAAAERVELTGIRHYEQQRVVDTKPWDAAASGIATPMIGFAHPRLQEALLAWAASLGVAVCRPAKAVGLATNGATTVSVQHEGGSAVYAARLVVAADGKTSAARRWIGGETLTDPAHHRFGGVLLTGVPTNDLLNNASTPGTGIFWFAVDAKATRLYLRLRPEQVRAMAVDRSFGAFVACAETFVPDGMLADARQAGPVGFFPNSNTWASRLATDSVVLIGDAAGAADPTGGLGTSLLFRDVRELSDLLLGDADWESALAEFERRRRAYYAVVRAFDHWANLLWCEEGNEADRRRERHARAKEHDPTVRRFAAVGTEGPDGLVADEAMRRAYFGETLGD